MRYGLHLRHANCGINLKDTYCYLRLQFVGDPTPCLVLATPTEDYSVPLLFGSADLAAHNDTIFHGERTVHSPGFPAPLMENAAWCRRVSCPEGVRHVSSCRRRRQLDTWGGGAGVGQVSRLIDRRGRLDGLVGLLRACVCG